MSDSFGFPQLVELCHQTHQEMQRWASRSVDTFLAVRNWLFGWYIVEYEQKGADRAEYGSRFLATLSERPQHVGIRGSSPTRLKLYRAFYQQYKQIRPTVSDESLPTLNAIHQFPQAVVEQLQQRFSLGWSHYVALLTIDNPEERRFYEIEAGANTWSVRELERQIAGSLYHRLALSRDKDAVRRLAREGQVVEKPADIIKNPIVLEFLELDESPNYTEDELEAAIIDKLETFLLELGKGFLFEARQKRFTFDNDHFHVDLVFYNRLLRCYVLIDLKRDKLTHQDLGQMQMYVNYFDRYVKTADELPTVGIVLCHRKNDANIFASKYQLYLPSKEELKRQLEKIGAELGGVE